MYLFVCVSCVPVLELVSMHSKRQKKTRSAGCASSSTSAHSGLSVCRVRDSDPASIRDLREGRPATFLCAGLWFIWGHLASV